MTDYENDPVLRILRNMGPINMSKFDDRLRLQKLAYLAQELGAGKRYFYSWYMHGPYSSPLTATLYVVEEQGMFPSAPILTKKESKIISQIRSLLGKNISKPRHLELFASIWYLCKITKDDRDTILEAMCRKKPHFKRHTVESALDALLKFKKSL